jgi:outer membrane protein assembly factor BamE
MRLVAVVLASLFLAGCGRLVYKMDVQQGNYVTQDVVARVKPGMTKAEVRQALGTPLVSDVFHGNRWDYYFSSEKNGRAEDRTLLSIFFENEKVVSVQGKARPAALPPVGQAEPAPAAQPSAATPAAAGPTTATVPVPGK